MFSGETKRMFVRWAIFLPLTLIISAFWRGYGFGINFLVGFLLYGAIYLAYELLAPNHLRTMP